MQKHMLALAVLVIIAVMILLGSRISTFASSHTVRTPLYKYYTSIQVEKGDSLWSIADDYIIDGVQSRDDFIDEVCQLNHISRQDILQSGEHLVIMYYSDEAK
jgi:cell division protein YceG involved in septum cleavage